MSATSRPPIVPTSGMTFIKDEKKNENEQYLKSWQNYREGLRKRIGQS